jgi:hypothetical protein
VKILFFATRDLLFWRVIGFVNVAGNFLLLYRLCVKAGGNLNAKDRKGGQTPLYLAAAAKQWDCVKYLLESGADSSIPCQVRKVGWGGGGGGRKKLFARQGC